jgi:hypothetical protein
MITTLDFVKTDCGDLSCHTGITFFADIVVINKCTGTIVTLTGYTAQMKIYDENETTIVDTITGTIDVSKGVISFVISAADTDDYEVGIYDYQINLTQVDNVFRLAQGKFEVSL